MKCSDPLGVNAMVPKLSISRRRHRRHYRTSDSILASSSHEVWRRRRREDDYSTFKARESGVRHRHRVYRLRNRGKSSPRRCDVCDGETSFMPPNLTLNHNLKKRLFLDIDSHFRIFQKRNGLRKEERGHSTFSRHWVFRSFCPSGWHPGGGGDNVDSFPYVFGDHVVRNSWSTSMKPFQMFFETEWSNKILPL